MKPGEWERLTDWPLTVAAIVFLAAYSVPIIWPQVDNSVVAACDVIAWATWALFAADLVMRVAIAEQRGRYLLRHWFDVLIVVLPFFRPLRLLRLVPLLRVLNRRATTGLRGRLSVYVAGGASLLAYCGALTVLDAERSNPDANIVNFGDAMWWAATTMTTVGYGDRYPTTGVGRIAAVALMVAGVAVLGVVTGTLAAWLVEQVKASDQQQTDRLRSEVADLRTQVTALLSDRGPATSRDYGESKTKERS